MFDYLVVGAGFAGSVIAERLANAGRSVLVVDRREHVGGNAYDEYDSAGVLVHRYGPHIFHTNSRDVFEYLSRFTEWRPYEHRVLASVDGKLVPMPINLRTVNELYGLRLTAAEMQTFLHERAERVREVRTSEDVVVSKVGRDLYEKLYRGYTRKQWGCDPSELDSTVAGRLPVRLNDDCRYFSDTYQYMPLHGYTRMFERMLTSPRIHVLLDSDYRDVRARVAHRTVVFTGPVDEYFDWRFGRLPYRSMEFRFESRRTSRAQPVATINFPDERPYTRVTEFKHLTGQTHPTTTLAYEYPRNTGDPYYPVPTGASAELYRQYEKLAKRTPGVYFAGRLGSYRYYNMDQVVAQALHLASELIGRSRSHMVAADAR